MDHFRMLTFVEDEGDDDDDVNGNNDAGCHTDIVQFAPFSLLITIS